MASSALLNIRLMAKNLTKPAFTAVRRSLATIRTQTIRAGRAMRSMMAGARTQAVALLAVLGGFQALVRGPAEFNREMAKVGTLGKEARDSLEGFTEQVQQLSVESGIAPEKLADGLFNVISAGTKASDAMETLNIATRLAVAGSADLSATVSGLAVVANSFGVSGADGINALAQSLFAAQVQGKTTLEEIANNVGKVGASFEAAHVDVDQMLVSLSLITRTAGSTEEATTELAGTMKAFIKPTEGMQKVLRSLGIEFSESMLEGRNFGQTIVDIREEALRIGVPFSQVFADQRGYRGALKLSSDEGRIFNEMLTEQRGLLDELDTSYELMQGTLAVTLDKFTSLMKVLAMDFADTAFDGLGDHLDGLIARVDELRIKAGIAGLEFRKSFLMVMPVLETLTTGFMFMLNSFLLAVEGIRFVWGQLASGVQDWIDVFSDIPGVGMFIETEVDKSNTRLDKLMASREEIASRLLVVQGAIARNLDLDSLIESARRTGADRDDPSLVPGLVERMLPQSEIDALKVELQVLFKTRAMLKKERMAIEVERENLIRTTGATKLFEGDKDTPLIAGPTSHELLRNLSERMDWEKQSVRIVEAVQGIQDAANGIKVIDWNEAEIASASRELKKLEKELAALGEKAPEALVALVKQTGEILENLEGGTVETERWYDSLVVFWENSKVAWASFKGGIEGAIKPVKTLEQTFKALGERVVKIAEDSLARFFDSVAAGTDRGEEAFKSFLRSVLSEINRLMSQKVVQQFAELLLSAGFSTGGGGGSGGDGGGATVDWGHGAGVEPFAHGGIVNNPTLAMIGEGGQSEAVVPLPNGRSIPVDFRGAGRGTETININISAVDGPSVERMLTSAAGRRAIEGAVRNARATRRDMR